ncbi:Stf0 family sulfotransferase [Falsirhodobacter sp. alg1]|uniref:Stf0 family sulfotransferase n=1 Tax=Falsirhodobacter sp. alg1 TaxID=1472418 RepID=UPI0005EEFA5E|nr:Stf0 family sulfotransferase [Falsirhodobacter sp. alg1]
MDIVKFLSQGGVHEKEIRRHFRGRVQYEGTGPVFDHPLYLMAFSNRSGSNLLAEYLRTTPLFSGFHEQLNHTTVCKQAERWGAETFPDLIRLGTEHLNEGRFMHGYKASWDQIVMLHRFNIPAMYTGVRVIHITRDDLLGQAISYHIASQTKRWTSVQKGEEIDPVYDTRQIAHLITSSQMSANAIQTLCSVFDIPRLHVTYEEVTRRPRRVVMRIGKFADADLTDWSPGKPKIQRQADRLNDIFRTRFIEDTKQALLR